MYLLRIFHKETVTICLLGEELAVQTKVEGKVLFTLLLCVLFTICILRVTCENNLTNLKE